MTINILHIGLANINGYTFNIVELDNGDECYSFFGVNFTTRFLYVDILYFKFKVFDKTDKL